MIGIVLVAHGVAFAQGTRQEPASVDPADLPPLPAADEELSSSATVLAASDVEEDVVVGAAKREQSLGNVASAVTVISGDRIRRFGYRTVGEAVSGVAGVYLEDNRINASLGIRGLLIGGDFNTRILILVDGATVNEAWGASSGLGFENLVSIDEIARIEVIRGPVSSVYGANAFFGIINIVTRGASESARAWGRFTVGKIGGVVGTAGFAQGGVNQQIRGSVLAMSRFGETLSVPDVGSNLKGDGANAFLASVVGTYGRTFGQIRAYRARRDSPFAPYNGDPDAPNPYIQLNTQLLVEGGHTRELSKRVTLSMRGYLNVYRFFDDITELQATGGTDTFLDYGDSTTAGGELRSRFEVLDDGKLGVTAGAEASYNRTESRSFYEGRESEGVRIPFNFRLTGIYTEVDSAMTDWLGGTLGLRFDDNSKVERRLSPRAALFLSKKEKYGLKLLYAQGFRNPSAYEAAFDDGTAFVAPNSDDVISANRGGALGAETIQSFEAVVWAKPVAGLSTRLSGFYWNASDIIVQQGVMVAGEMGPEPRLQFQNLASYITQGVEAEASYRTASGWYGFAGAALARVGSADERGESIEYGNTVDAAQVMGAFGISTPKLFGHTHLSAEANFIGRRPTRNDIDDNPSPDSPAWLGLNLVAYVPNIRGFDITLATRNLLGKRDQLPAAGDYDRDVPTSVVIPRVPGEGREVYLKVGYAY